jgi:hypothetical protein
LPAPFPAVLAATRKVSAQALVAYRGNFYSVPPELTGTTVTVAHRLGATSIDITTGSTTCRLPTVVARSRPQHGAARRARPCAGELIAVLREFAEHDWRWYRHLVAEVAAHAPLDVAAVHCPVRFLAGR